MSVIATNTEIAPYTIKKFLGLNISTTGDTQIKDGESGNMTNFVITNDYKLKKCDGYKTVYKFNSKPTGIYTYKDNNDTYLLIVADGNIYRISQTSLDNDETWEDLNPEIIGSVGNYDATFFLFDGKVYMLNGHKYQYYDGTTFKDVEGYIPLVLFSTNPSSGSGTEYDPINLLTGKKHMTFNGDGTAKEYHLAEKNIDRILKVIVDGEETTNYTSNLVDGTVTFTTAPTNAMDNVDIYWEKEGNTRHFIDNMRAGIVYGGNVDTKVFLYGNENEPNRIRFSATAGGTPSAEYFPTTNLADIGPSNFTVTDLTRQYDRLIATTNRPEAYTIGIDLIDIEGTATASVTTIPLNEVHGNIAFAQGQVINNNPVTIEKGQIIEWRSTTIRDERNMIVISEKIKEDLITVDLKNAKTCDFQDKNELWIAIGTKIYIYNYFNGTFSRLNLPINIGLLQVVGNYMYITDLSGNLYKFDENYQDFNGEIIKAHWEMNFSNFGASYLRKTLRKVWITMQPQTKSSAEIGYVSNKDESSTKKTIAYQLTLLDDVDFANWSFQVSVNPQPFRLKIKAKKFTNLKLTIDNENTDDCTILELALKLENGGESK